MEIKVVKFRRDGFYTQPFVFGGEEGPDKYDKNIRYRGSLQNYLIDTGKEVILVDTGLPAGTPERQKKHPTRIQRSSQERTSAPTWRHLLPSATSPSR